MLTPSVAGSVSYVFQLFLSSSESHVPSLVCLTCWSVDQLFLSKQGHRAEDRLASLCWDGEGSLGKGTKECKYLLCDLCLCVIMLLAHILSQHLSSESFEHFGLSNRVTSQEMLSPANSDLPSVDGTWRKPRAGMEQSSVPIPPCQRVPSLSV